MIRLWDEAEVELKAVRVQSMREARGVPSQYIPLLTLAQHEVLVRVYMVSVVCTSTVFLSTIDRAKVLYNKLARTRAFPAPAPALERRRTKRRALEGCHWPAAAKARVCPFGASPLLQIELVYGIPKASVTDSTMTAEQESYPCQSKLIRVGSWRQERSR